MGVPRRVIDAGYGGDAPALWPALMGWVAGGGLLMALALAAFSLSVAATLLPGRATVPPLPHWDAAITPRPGAAALVGPLAVLVIVIGMYAATATGFELMRALPIEAAGGAHGH